eukprot:CAMPEP_0196813424 /NCGR_PEP_ID=MMETSP1362-20130617/36598_1 /TAXON_ID=163516 /ORGANISM="Leptocylindrus danicus, Strain CCMP1856" /LENGTH=220 /DNA_ID=CAMNT_0042189655 /DNA_START=79 /DNA_END=741 /DNA_ORIENTATION=-
MEKLADLEARVQNLEKIKLKIPSDKQGDVTKDEISAISRARHHVESKKCYSASWKWVPKDYYSKQLDQRSVILGARSPMQLCKALLMENRSVEAKQFDRLNAQFYLVVVQYGAELNTKKLEIEVRALKPLQERLEASKFNFRLASAEDNDRLTGYVHNSVTPFGMIAQATVPIILASAVVKDIKFMFMGGGHVDLKLGMAVDEFVKATGAFVLDVSDSRR